MDTLGYQYKFNVGIERVKCNCRPILCPLSQPLKRLFLEINSSLSYVDFNQWIKLPYLKNTISNFKASCTKLELKEWPFDLLTQLICFKVLSYMVWKSAIHIMHYTGCPNKKETGTNMPITLNYMLINLLISNKQSY